MDSALPESQPDAADQGDQDGTHYCRETHGSGE